MDRGVVAGFKMVNVSCELTFGSYHDVDSSEIAYKIAASQAFQEASKHAKAVILEPIMKLEVVAPEKFMGDITGSIASKRGMIEGTQPKGPSPLDYRESASRRNVRIHDAAPLHDVGTGKRHDGIRPLRSRPAAGRKRNSGGKEVSLTYFCLSHILSATHSMRFFRRCIYKFKSINKK